MGLFHSVPKYRLHRKVGTEGEFSGLKGEKYGVRGAGAENLASLQPPDLATLQPGPAHDPEGRVGEPMGEPTLPASLLFSEHASHHLTACQGASARHSTPLVGGVLGVPQLLTSGPFSCPSSSRPHLLPLLCSLLLFKLLPKLEHFPGSDLGCLHLLLALSLGNFISAQLPMCYKHPHIGVLGPSECPGTQARALSSLLDSSTWTPCSHLKPQLNEACRPCPDPLNLLLAVSSPG